MPKKLLTAIAAGIGSYIAVAVPTGILTGFIFGTFRLEEYAGWAVLFIQLSALGVGFLVGRIVYRRLKHRPVPGRGLAVDGSLVGADLPQ